MRQAHPPHRHRPCDPRAAPLPALAESIHAVLYKNPQCRCCGESYAAYLEQNGFTVDVKPTNDYLTEISSKAGVPADLEGCHTMFVEGYVVDGLVPVDVIPKTPQGEAGHRRHTLAGHAHGRARHGGDQDRTLHHLCHKQGRLGAKGLRGRVMTRRLALVICALALASAMPAQAQDAPQISSSTRRRSLCRTSTSKTPRASRSGWPTSTARSFC